MAGYADYIEKVMHELGDNAPDIAEAIQGNVYAPTKDGYEQAKQDAVNALVSNKSSREADQFENFLRRLDRELADKIDPYVSMRNAAVGFIYLKAGVKAVDSIVTAPDRNREFQSEDERLDSIAETWRDNFTQFVNDHPKLVNKLPAEEFVAKLSEAKDAAIAAREEFKQVAESAPQPMRQRGSRGRPLPPLPTTELTVSTKMRDAISQVGADIEVPKDISPRDILSHVRQNRTKIVAARSSREFNQLERELKGLIEEVKVQKEANPPTPSAAAASETTRRRPQSVPVAQASTQKVRPVQRPHSSPPPVRQMSALDLSVSQRMRDAVSLVDADIEIPANLSPKEIVKRVMENKSKIVGDRDFRRYQGLLNALENLEAQSRTPQEASSTVENNTSPEPQPTTGTSQEISDEELDRLTDAIIQGEPFNESPHETDLSLVWEMLNEEGQDSTLMDNFEEIDPPVAPPEAPQRDSNEGPPRLTTWSNPPRRPTMNVASTGPATPSSPPTSSLSEFCDRLSEQLHGNVRHETVRGNLLHKFTFPDNSAVTVKGEEWNGFEVIPKDPKSYGRAAQIVSGMQQPNIEISMDGGTPNERLALFKECMNLDPAVIIKDFDQEFRNYNQQELPKSITDKYTEATGKPDPRPDIAPPRETPQR